MSNVKLSYSTPNRTELSGSIIWDEVYSSEKTFELTNETVSIPLTKLPAVNMILITAVYNEDSDTPTPVKIGQDAPVVLKIGTELVPVFGKGILLQNVQPASLDVISSETRKIKCYVYVSSKAS